jgi:hypothetical protein
MKTGKIIDHKHKWVHTLRNSEFTISFDQSEFGPYTFIFDRERLYFDENLNERGSFFFPLKEQLFNNTEIFIERNDIVIALWERGSFSWESRVFLEIVNLTNANKYRFYPEQVSLIYNARTSIVIYYKKWDTYKRLELDIKTLEKKSEISTQVSAFFKLFYNYTDKTYGRLIYKANAKSHQAWYFVEELIISDTLMPMYFLRDNFLIDTYWNEKIDVWEASLTWEL